jgi:AcrR family transcriptional regulator
LANKPTREKILDTSLSMFNALGERNVTTNHIADELGISPGNLYYYFKNKDDIVAQLFAVYEARMDDVLSRRKRSLTLDDVQLQLQRVFECMWTYRFLYRDLVDILSRHRKLRQRFSRLLNRAEDSALVAMRGLVDAKILTATNEEMQATAENVVLTTTFWLNYHTVRNKSEASQSDIADGVERLMRLIAPNAA